MAPVDGQAVMAMNNVQQSTATIPLSTLIDYIIQRTYHELTVLSELLPRKTDMERKIEIVQFASKTRQLFVRLLALVKWANSAGKVDKCGMITSFLEQQSMYYVETADMLARMSRVTLVRARLPAFCLPSAIDVLTTGTYPRLPNCIKEKIIPDDSITEKERFETLNRLNQIIEHRVVTVTLPPLMRNLRIENGRVKFMVPHEFEATLTLMGDSPTIPWRLLDISILVEDPETGSGKSLVHGLQVKYIHDLVQSRMIDCEKPLHELYSCLHNFCLSLQLEVLHSQAQKLYHQRIGDHIRMEEYSPGKSLSLSYWRDSLVKKEGKHYQPPIYKLKIYVDEEQPHKPLHIAHFPQIQGSESIKVAQTIKSNYLSLEKLLMHTIHVRSTGKLKDLERELRVLTHGLCDLKEVPTVLYCSVLNPCMEAEKLCITVDALKGTFLVSMKETESNLTIDIQDSLNDNHKELKSLLSELRLTIGLSRIAPSVQDITVGCFESLPLTNLAGHPLEKLPKHRMYIRVPKMANYYLVVTVTEKEDRSLLYEHYILEVSQSSQKENQALPSGLPEGGESEPSNFMRALHLVHLDTLLCTHSTGSKLFEPEPEDANIWMRKRKSFLKDPTQNLAAKKPRHSAYFIPEVSHILALCEDQIPFMLIGKELLENGIAHQGIEIDGDNTALALTLIDALPSPGISQEAFERLRNDLLSCKLRIQRKSNHYVLVESIFTNCPIKAVESEKKEVERVIFGYDINSVGKVVQSLLDDWSVVANLYSCVIDFAEVYYDNKEMQENIEIKAFTYKRLTLAYGPNKSYLVSIQYKHETSNKFNISFGTCKPCPMANPHSVMITLLQKQLNQTKSIALLAQLLIDTWSPLTSIGKLNVTPVVGVTKVSSHIVPSFVVIPMTTSRVKIVYRKIYGLDINFRANGLVSIKDSCCSAFDNAHALERSIIPSLKTFLNQYVDDPTTLGSHGRQRNFADDDHPPSPCLASPMENFLQPASVGSPGGSSRAPGGVAGSKDTGLRFHNNPMTPPSNPHTPASPRMSQVAPSPSAYIGTPSPMMMQGSPNPNMHAPSPGSFQPSPAQIPIPSPATGPFISPQAGSVLSPPTRTLPQKFWATSLPTLLTHEAFSRMLEPGPLSGFSRPEAHALCCPLERFLGSVEMRKVWNGCMNDEKLTIVKNTEPGVIEVKGESLQFRVALNSTHLQTLHLKVSPFPEFVGKWDMSELQLIEKFFEMKVAGPPYKSGSAVAFSKLLTLPNRILKQMIQVIKMEMYPESSQRWKVKWCLTYPHGGPPITNVGQAAVVVKTKILFILELSRPLNTNSAEQQRLIIPLIYNPAANTMDVPDQNPQANPNHGLYQAIRNIMSRGRELMPDQTQCCIYPAVRELVNEFQY